MKRIIPILMFLMCLSLAAATDIQMKSNEVYSAQFQVGSSNGFELKDCIPYFSGDLADQNFVVLQPTTFDLQPGESQDVLVSFQEPEQGYYQDKLNVRCTRYKSGEFVGAGDIISPTDAPSYNVVVQMAGVGQAYIISPVNGFVFLSNPPSTEKATFSIVNTGTVDLDVNFELSAEYPNIKISPIRTNIPEGELEVFTVTVETQEDFEYLKTEIPVRIGDYGDVFIVEGESESFASTGGAALASVAFGDVEVQGLKIPSWLLILVLVVAFYYVYKESKK